MIYKIKNRINNKYYIGYTKYNLEKRWNEHIYAANIRDSHYRIHAAIRKYGEDNFEIDILKEDGTIDDETFFIEEYDSYNNGYNSNEGGTGLVYHDEKTKKKMSENNRWRGKNRSGKNNPMFGQTHSKEARDKIRKAQKGNKNRLGAVLTEETKRKISEANKGKKGWNKGVPMTEEAKKKLSKSKTGVKLPHTCKKYKIIWPDGREEIIVGIHAFAKENNLHTGNLVSVAKGRLKQYKGFKCEYI